MIEKIKSINDVIVGDNLRRTIVYENGHPIMDENCLSIHNYIVLALFNDNTILVFSDNGVVMRKSILEFCKKVNHND